MIPWDMKFCIKAGQLYNSYPYALQPFHLNTHEKFSPYLLEYRFQYKNNFIICDTFINGKGRNDFIFLMNENIMSSNYTC
jgi:hypothetical protein